jgi:hypothetical protein
VTIQILITLVSAFIIIKACGKLRKREVHAQTFTAWILFWLLVIALVWQPNLTDTLARFLQVTRGADAVFYLSLVGIFYLLFRAFIRMERMEQEITALVRELALRSKNDTNNQS